MASIGEPTSKDLIVALNDMYNSWATICSGIFSLQKDFDDVGIDDWFNDALNSSYVSVGVPANDGSTDGTQEP